jgi:hypothetical protein
MTCLLYLGLPNSGSVLCVCVDVVEFVHCKMWCCCSGSVFRWSVGMPCVFLCYFYFYGLILLCVVCVRGIVWNYICNYNKFFVEFLMKETSDLSRQLQVLKLLSPSLTISPGKKNLT